jgi:nucleotide-binding universal stress UspA family protein
MPGLIVVGYDGSDHAADALELGRVLADLSGADVVVACAYPEDPLAESATGGETSRELREDAEQRLARARERVGVNRRVDFRALAGHSPSHVLHELAEQLGAEAIVLGATHHGTALRLLAGSTPEHVLDHAPCPVAVAPEGFAARGVTAPRRIAVGFDDSPEAARALEAAARLARESGAPLRLVTALGPTAVPLHAPLDVTTYDQLAALTREQARTRLEEAVARLPGVEAEIELREGDPVHALLEDAREDDLLVAGSRRGGPLRRVLLGSVSRHLLRSAACPVLIVPSGEDEPE